jgi:2-deoxy-D-gluconate 3-dehydrogenase
MGILDSFKLDGKIAIVTGASRGLGQAMAVALAEAGADVAVVARSDLSETAEKIEGCGRRCLKINADLADIGCVDHIVSTTCENMGGIDILVNNAGTTLRAPVTEFTSQQWDHVLNVNLRTVFFLSQAAAKVYIEQGRGGKIINIASMMSFQGGILITPYAAAKTALVGITRSMATELAEYKINVNAIAPGYFATEFTRPIQEDPERNPAIVERIPVGRWGKPEELAGAVVFLASAASDYMQGFTLAIDGGWLAR